MPVGLRNVGSSVIGGRRGDRDTVDALAAKLIEADPAAVRISCRVADWLGKSDLVSLEPFFVGTC